jgi:hypothetical protein
MYCRSSTLRRWLVPKTAEARNPGRCAGIPLRFVRPTLPALVLRFLHDLL